MRATLSRLRVGHCASDEASGRVGGSQSAVILSARTALGGD